MREAPLDGVMRLPRPMRLAAAPRRLRILFLYSRLPLPMTRGDEQMAAHLLEFLHARGHAVDFVTLDAGQGLAPGHRAWLEQRCRRLVILPQTRLRSVIGAALGLASGRPLQVGWFHNRAQLAWAGRAAAEPYDVAYALYVRSVEALRAVRRQGRPGPVTVMDLHLSQHLNSRRLAETTRSRPERLLHRLESRLLRAYEARVWRHFTRVRLAGPCDLAAIREACRAEGVPEIDNAILGPHGVDSERFRPRPELAVEPDSVVLTGVMRYPPNVQGALWLAAEVWPKVRAARPRARLWLVGRDPLPAVRALDGRDGITVTGTVDEPALWIAKAAVCTAPIRAAAGLQNKLLEALAMGKAVVATTAANEGIGAIPGRDLLIADAPETFAQALLDLLADPPRAARLGTAARAFIEAGWTWEAHFLRLERDFLAALDEARAGMKAPARCDEAVTV
jgi:glycosyltransferase involved in cell wall biosynthesis